MNRTNKLTQAHTRTRTHTRRAHTHTHTHAHAHNVIHRHWHCHPHAHAHVRAHVNQAWFGEALFVRSAGYKHVCIIIILITSSYTFLMGWCSNCSSIRVVGGRVLYNVMTAPCHITSTNCAPEEVSSYHNKPEWYCRVLTVKLRTF